MFDTVAETLHELYGLACTVTPAGGADVATTVRCQAGQANESAGRQARRERTTAILYLRRSAVATRPTRGAKIVIAASSAWDETWTLTTDAEPSADDEWRCLCLSERNAHTIAAAGGARRPV